VAGAGVVIVALTVAAFWLSYAHLAEIAMAHGLSGARAWAWPACLDAFIVAGELLMLRAALAGRIDRWAIALTASGSLGSIALNVWGVGTSAQTLDYVVAGVPPTAALLAFGVLMRQVHHWLADDTTTADRPALVICDGGLLAVPKVLALPREKTKLPEAKRSAARRPAKAKTPPKRTDAEVLAEARSVTADWTDAALTADRLRMELRISPERARVLRETLRAERSQNERELAGVGS
jgi:hypothetical protein